jgi:hypothetical protein
LYPDGLDAVFDCQGGEDCAKGMSLLGHSGVYVIYGSANMVTGENRSIFSVAKSWWSQVEKVSPLRLIDDNKGVIGFNLRHLIKHKPELVEQELVKIWSLMAQAKVDPILDQTFYLEKAVKAMQRMHERKNIGKVLMKTEVPPPELDAPVAEPAGTSNSNNSTAQAESNVDNKNGTKDAKPEEDKAKVENGSNKGQQQEKPAKPTSVEENNGDQAKVSKNEEGQGQGQSTTAEESGSPENGAGGQQ